MSDQTEDPVLVLGATGLQGGAVLRALLAAGVPVRALVRDAANAQSLVDLGALLAIGTFEDRATLVAACDGVRAVFSMQNAPLADADSERNAGRNIVEAARAAGVAQIVHTSVSGTGTYHRQMPDWGTGRWNENYWESKACVEDAVRNAGFDCYTILKPAFMMENFARPKAGYLFPDLVDGRLVTAIEPGRKLALISAVDIGRTACAAVLDPLRFNGAEIELAGDALTMTEIAAILSSTTGRRIEAVSLPAAEVIARGQFPGWVNSQEWQNHSGYPATPAHAQPFGIMPVNFADWAKRNISLIAGR
ncbi:MAG: NmrA/HSCARG family protein [Sphingorhabdus sp.]